MHKVRTFAVDDAMGRDASHDAEHIKRVTEKALFLAKAWQEEDSTVVIDPVVVECVALLHDVNDHKYGNDKDLKQVLSSLYKDEKKIDWIISLIDRVSFSREKRELEEQGMWPPVHRDEVQMLPADYPPELAVVQDADRLDALGPVGLFRLFTYGGVQGNSMDTTLEHIWDKLVHLSNMMKTPPGFKEADEYDMFLRDYLFALNKQRQIQ